MVSRDFSGAKECADKSWRSPGHGERKATGGRKLHGRAMNGTSSCVRCGPRFNRKTAMQMKKRPQYIASTKTCERNAGSWKESTIEVRRVARRLRIQFSGRCFAPGGSGVSRQGGGDARHGPCRSRRSVRFSTIPHGGKVRGDSSACRSRSFCPRFWKPSRSASVDAKFPLGAARATAPARGKPDWIPESVPSHDALQTARKGKRNGNGHAGGNRRIRRRARVFDGRRGRGVGCFTLEQRLRRSAQEHRKADSDLRKEQRLCRGAAPSRSCRRAPKPGGRSARGNTKPSSSCNERGSLRARLRAR